MRLLARVKLKSPASPLIPQLHSLLGPMFRDAGFPDGAVQVLHFSEEDVADRVGDLIAHPDIRVGFCVSAGVLTDW